MGFYLGFILGAILLVFVIRYLTLFRLFMILICAAGMAFSGLLGFFLVWPVQEYCHPAVGALIGALIWAGVSSYSCYQDSQRSAESLPSSLHQS